MPTDRADRPTLDTHHTDADDGHSAATAQPASPGTLLLVEDDTDISGLVASALGSLGHQVTVATTGREAIARFESQSFSLVILDIGLPDMSGIEVLRALRANSDVPVLVLSAASSLDDRVNGFDLGADDYVVKPFEMPELDRRIRALLRRSAAPRSEETLLGPTGIRLQLRAHQVFVDAEEIHLTPKEFDVLRVLLARRGEVVAPDDLSVDIWGYETFGSRNYVEAHVSRLRTKLAEAGARDIIATVRGVGYMIR